MDVKNFPVPLKTLQTLDLYREGRSLLFSPSPFLFFFLFLSCSVFRPSKSELSFVHFQWTSVTTRPTCEISNHQFLHLSKMTSTRVTRSSHVQEQCLEFTGRFMTSATMRHSWETPNHCSSRQQKMASTGVAFSPHMSG